MKNEVSESDVEVVQLPLLATEEAERGCCDGRKMTKMQIGTAGLHFPDLRKKGLSCKSPWISVKHDAESVNRTKYDRLKTKNENCELSAKRFPKFGNRFEQTQRLTRSSGIGLSKLKGLREVRESL